MLNHTPHKTPRIQPVNDQNHLSSTKYSQTSHPRSEGPIATTNQPSSTSLLNEPSHQETDNQRSYAQAASLSTHSSEYPQPIPTLVTDKTSKLNSDDEKDARKHNSIKNPAVDAATPDTAKTTDKLLQADTHPAGKQSTNTEKGKNEANNLQQTESLCKDPYTEEDQYHWKGATLTIGSRNQTTEVDENDKLYREALTSLTTTSNYNVTEKQKSIYNKRYYLDRDDPVQQEICRWHMLGKCKFGKICDFLHIEPQPFPAWAQSN